MPSTIIGLVTKHKDRRITFIISNTFAMYDNFSELIRWSALLKISQFIDEVTRKKSASDLKKALLQKIF